MHKIKKDYKIQIKKKHYISKFEFPLAYTQYLNPLEIPRLAPKSTDSETDHCRCLHRIYNWVCFHSQ